MQENKFNIKSLALHFGVLAPVFLSLILAIILFVAYVFTFIAMEIILTFAPCALVVILTILAICKMIKWYQITKNNYKFLFCGLLVIPAPISLVIAIIISRDNEYTPCENFSILLSTIWMYEICVAIGGRLIEGPKLAPKLNYKKNWSGLAVGIIMSSIALSQLLGEDLSYFRYDQRWLLALHAVVLCILAEMGSLLMAYFKCKFKVYNEKNAIIGYNWFLNRFHSLIFTAPILYALGK